MKRFIEGKWMNDEEVIDFLVERIFLLQVQIKDFKKKQLIGRG